MSYLSENWKQCRKCGSYMPPDWARCGRCGYPANRRGRGRGKGWIVLLLLVLSIFIFKDQLIRLIPSQIKDRIADVLPGNTVTPEVTGSQNREGKNGSTESATKTPAKPNSAATAQGGKPANRAETEEEIRSLIHNALKNADSSVRVPVLHSDNDSEAVFKIIQRVILDDPEIMFYEGCTYRTDGLITFNYLKSRSDILKAVDTVDQKADEILKQIITPGMSAYKKELAIHDYIVRSTQYDIKNLKNDTVPPEGNEAYGPLIDGKAVCGGYAKAMKLLLGRAGIESYVVSGDSKGELHAWNIVKLPSGYYQVDATWDDPVMDSGDQVLEHTYFNLTDKDIAVDHSWTKADYPSCTSTAENYFYASKLVASSDDAFTSLLREAIKSGKDSVSIRLTGSAASEDIQGLIEKAANKLRMGSFTYIVNKDYKVVDFWF